MDLPALRTISVFHENGIARLHRVHVGTGTDLLARTACWPTTTAAGALCERADVGTRQKPGQQDRQGKTVSRFQAILHTACEDIKTEQAQRVTDRQTDRQTDGKAF